MNRSERALPQHREILRVGARQPLRAEFTVFLEEIPSGICGLWRRLRGTDNGAVERVVAADWDWRIFSETLLAHKAEIIQDLQKKGYVVAMDADGISDSPRSLTPM